MSAGGIDGDREAEVAFAGLLGQAGMLRDGRLTSAELVNLLLRRIAALDPEIRAFRLVLADDARTAAVAADEARALGDTRPLLGVPIAIKDTVAVAGTAALLGTGSPEPVATNDDELVRRLRAAGLIVLGKTHLPELALWAATESTAHGITRNPWDRDRTPGGSSGGSAAAVAAGMVAAAHASDGLGSIRIPASCSGLVGLKPTHGRVPLGPDPDHWLGMSHAGFVTRSVRDTAALLDVAAGDEELSRAIKTSGEQLRVAATTRGPTPVPVHRDVRSTFDRTVDVLRDLGHTVVTATPEYSAMLPQSTSVRYLAGAAEDVHRLVDPTGTERRTRQLAAMGRRIPERTRVWARRFGNEFGERMLSFFDDVDVLVTPTMPVLPRRAGCLGDRGLARTLTLMAPCATYTGPWNACGFPAVSLPVGTSGDGLPIGVQLIGPPDSEGRLLNLAATLEPVAGWVERRPPLA